MAQRRKIKLSECSVFHYWRLAYRSVLFVAATVIYILGRVRGGGTLWEWAESRWFLLPAIWVIFAVEMVSRMFPSRIESMGCEKQFARNYRPPAEPREPALQEERGAWLVLVSWVALNGVIGMLYFLGILDQGIMLLICLAYSVCDMVCILFFCPFQTWMLKNRCCTTCRIYNWDYAMMFTPLLFVPGLYTWSLLAMAIVLLLAWEVRYALYPERFSEATNRSLACANCTEKLCHHKKQLLRLWEQWKLQAERLQQRLEKR